MKLVIVQITEYFPDCQIPLKSSGTIRLTNLFLYCQILQHAHQFEFSDTSYKGNSDFEFCLGSGPTWFLHKSILEKRCPAPLLIDRKRLESFAFSEQIYEALITFIYQDKLVQLQFCQLMDLYMLVSLYGMQEFGDYILLQINCYSNSMIESAFSKLMQYPEFNSKLFYRLYSFIYHQEGCNEDVISLITEGPESFVRLAIRSILASPTPANLSTSSPFGKLFQVAEELFPSEYHQLVLEDSDSSSNNDGDSTDFTIQCEGRSFPCHKLLLILRWPYFANAMSFDGSEATSNTLQLPHDTFAAESTKVFIRYLYTNVVLNGISASVAHNILQNAQYFGLVSTDKVPLPSMFHLIEQCRSVVFDSLEVENCVTFLKGALEYGNDHQVNRARSFIAKLIEDGKIRSIRHELKSLPPEEGFKLLIWE